MAGGSHDLGLLGSNMSREELTSFLDARDRKNPRRGLSWSDRALGLVVIAAIHAFMPTPEHSSITGLVSDIAVLKADFQHTVAQVADHETRIRALERGK